MKCPACGSEAITEMTQRGDDERKFVGRCGHWWTEAVEVRIPPAEIIDLLNRQHPELQPKKGFFRRLFGSE